MSLHWPARKCARQDGSAAQVLQLLEQRADVNERDHRGKTPLHWALFGQHNNDGHNHDDAQLEIIQALLQHRADPTLKCERDGSMLTPAEHGARRGVTLRLLQPVIDAEATVNE